ncbi:amidohydrolase [Microbacterium sp. zg.Y909]|uniref:amidohydrolase n=1 Tax=Microbacterium sp. zg.Y909 TaxID=2969413 RepID=UPI00214C9618|nr:amidohydrolase family protein [Microbacterium sp. zg.Y909]MCR2824863.1 amidohydrolase family protein [Microbacterium sp. zg.Y909]
MNPTSLTLRNARPYGGEPVDIVIDDGVIAAIGPAGSVAPVGDVVDVAGRFVGPGLWDAHVHFTQWVIRRRRVDLTATTSAEDVLAAVRTARATGAPLTDGMLIGYGFRDGLWPHPPTLASLDRAEPDLPVVLISADLHCAWMNSPAARRLGLPLDASGVISEAPWLAALQRIQEATSVPAAAYGDAADAAARRGVVGVVEYESTDNVAEWTERVARGVSSLRVDVAVWPDRLDAAIAAGLRTGDLLEPAGLITMGRLKVIVDGSLNTRTAWCWDPYPGVDPASTHACGVESVPVDELRRLLERAHGAGIGAAVHAIGDRANTEVIDVFEQLGMSGIIEHAQLVGEGDFARFARLGLTASVQPEHAMDDRDVADRYWKGRTGRAFAFGSLHRAGAALRLGSDAPVSPLDPWHAIASATARSRGDRETWHPEQRLPMDAALAASSRSRLAVGEPADLVIVDRDPLSCDRDGLRGMPVAATLLGGRFTWRDL